MSGSLKNILVKVAGKGLENAEAEKVVLAPGTKVKDVIAQLGLQNFRLTKDSSNLDPEADLYTLVSDGTQLLASSNPDLGE
jgi:hypothetical protein